MSPGNHHNKWLLYSSTVMLVSFLLVVDHISVVECGLQSSSLSAVENETVGKVRGKVSGNSLIGSNNNDPRGHEKPSSYVNNDGKSNNINDFHSPRIEFSSDIEDEDEDEGDSYGDDNSLEIDGSDEEYIENHEHEEKFGRPQIGKCCPVGQGLNLQGACKVVTPNHLKHHDTFWFPEKVYHANITFKPDISEWDIKVVNHLNCKPDERVEIISDMNKFVVLSDGSLLIVHQNMLFPPLEFCMEQQIGKGARRVVKACFSRKELCDDKQCLRKCCPEGSVTEFYHTRCDRSHLSHAFNFNNESRSILSGTPQCEFGSYFLTFDFNYTISNNGTIITSQFSSPFYGYCVDYFTNTTGSIINDQPERMALVCFDDPANIIQDGYRGLIEVSPGVSAVLGIAMLISAICLAIAAAISWRLPELRSLHGKCQLSHLATMFAFYICLAITQLGVKIIPQGLCTFFGIFIHICSLSSFLWLNLLCVNIYLTFRSLRPPLAARRDENRRLAFLCVYAWGIPAAFCLFLYILDSTEPGRLNPMPGPEYGKRKCLISNREAEFAYLFGPVGILLLFNGLLFCLTAQELLCGLWRLDNSDSINFRRKSMGIVVAKLGIVMGMGWILDVVSWAIGAESSYIFYTVDLFNSLQGVFISVILLWRKRVLEVLHLRKPSVCKDETLTARPFLAKNNSVNMTSNGDHDTSLVLVQDQ